MTYNMVHASALSFGAGLRFHLGQKPKSLITIYSETRAEWMMSCLGAFSQVFRRDFFYLDMGLYILMIVSIDFIFNQWSLLFQNIGVATVYTNLGDDAVVHALNETGTEIVVTSRDLLPKFKKLLAEVCNGCKTTFNMM